MKRVAEGVAAGFGADRVGRFPADLRAADQRRGSAASIADTAAELVGEDSVDRKKPPGMGSEDFAFMMEQVPGAYIQVGNGETSGQLHNQHYDFNDEATPYGAALFARLVERRLKRGTE